MAKRKTFAQIESDARKSEREDTVATCCRILKHQFGLPEVAEQLWEIHSKGKPTIQTAHEAYMADPWKHNGANWYSGFDTI